MDEEFSAEKKVHRKPKAGRKAKKKNKDDEQVNLTARQRNPKAFAINSAVGAERKFRRHQDLETKKHHIPVVDRTPIEPPPIVVAVVGPPKVGKSTLIRCLIKNFTKKPLTEIKGPVTLVSGKRKRITLMECNNDINSMIDIAKVADLVLLLIDGSFGFEMEIFEFLNICQVHGMPKIMGVLTHLDMIKNSKVLKHTKKTLKHRFWTEVYQGAKLFYLSGILHGEYLRTEVHRFSRFISVIKFRPLLWQTSHSYILADRIEDLSPPEMIRQNPKCDRTVSLYGYVRGIPLNKHLSVHIPGCGDSKIADVSFLPDPCPLPDTIKKRSLVEKERLIYAPFSGIGGIVYDKDGVYVELAGSHSYNKREDREEHELFATLADTRETLDTKIAKSEMRIFSNTEPIKADEFQQNEVLSDKYEEEIVIDEETKRKRRKVIFKENSELDEMIGMGQEDEDEEDTEEEDTDSENENKTFKKKKGKRSKEEFDSEDETNMDWEEDVVDKPPWETNLNAGVAKGNSEIRDKIREALSLFDLHEKNENGHEEGESDEESDSGLDGEEMGNDDTALNWKDNLAQKAADSFVIRQNTNSNLWKLVYGNNLQGSEENEKEEANETIGGIFKVISSKQREKLLQKDLSNQEDGSKFSVPHIRNWNDEKVSDEIRDCFVTGKWKSSEDATNLLKMDDEDMFGDFEDLETGEKFEEKEDEKEGEEEEPKPAKKLSKEELIEKKKKLKEKFNAEYDDKDGNDGTYYDEIKEEAIRQSQLNKNKFEDLDDEIRVQLEGYRAGMYVRVELKNIPCELITNFDPTYPLIVGGLQPGEENVGYVNTRIRKHRWYNRILKTKNPIIVSLGWRRFQTVPVYSVLEDNMRNRMLKYTPEHVTCMAHFWGPLTKPGTGFLAVQDVSVREEGFRIIATGTIADTNQSTQIMKKLKLVGEPMKIYRKTAFVKNMFNSALEVAKFEGAKIRTVSGIRGQIKKACSKPEGVFRATFEDAIKMNDIVFCRTWFKVDVPKFYNPVTSLLLPVSQKEKWLGMKTLGQLKREQGIRNDPQEDSLYTPVVRKPKVFKELKIPKRLQRDLPFKDKPKGLKFGPKDNLKKKRVAVVRDDHEYKVASLMKMLRVNYNDKQKKEKEEMIKRVAQHKKQRKIQEKSKQQKEKLKKKSYFTKETKRKVIEEKRKNK